MPPGPPVVSAGAVLACLPPGVGAVAVRAGHKVVVAAAPDDVVVASGPRALAALDRLDAGWWGGFLTYELGRGIERVFARKQPSDDVPDVVLARFPARLVLDPASGTHVTVGGGHARELLVDAARTAATAGASVPAGPALDQWTSSLDRLAFEQAVHAILELIRAGDCYQVNLTRRLVCDHEADPIALFAALEARNPAPHAAFVRLEDAAGCPPLSIVSASPERFLSWQGRRVETRPIKGTGMDQHQLRESAKDRAENVMIVDLARNDLGRVCEPGSISVPSLCEIEAHPGLYHLVSTVRGRRRDGIGVGALVRATFPPASVTGAPKPRVLQIIEDLEPVPRGVYCGAVGWIDTEHDAGDLNVAIRTFAVTGGSTHLGVGSGIVADSQPGGEWSETELKAARLLATASSGMAESRLVGAGR